MSKLETYAAPRFLPLADEISFDRRNIVNNPSVIEDNSESKCDGRRTIRGANERSSALLLITGPKLAVDMMVPSDQYRPLYTKMTTQLEVGDLSLIHNTTFDPKHRRPATSVCRCLRQRPIHIKRG